MIVCFFVCLIKTFPNLITKQNPTRGNHVNFYVIWLSNSNSHLLHFPLLKRKTKSCACSRISGSGLKNVTILFCSLALLMWSKEMGTEMICATNHNSSRNGGDFFLYIFHRGFHYVPPNMDGKPYAIYIQDWHRFIPMYGGIDENSLALVCCYWIYDSVYVSTVWNNDGMVDIWTMQRTRTEATQRCVLAISLNNVCMAVSVNALDRTQQRTS